MRRTKTAVTFLALLAALPPNAPASADIEEAELMRTVERLASPDLRGRLAGSPGYIQAAREAAESLRSWGLSPAGTLSDPDDGSAASAAASAATADSSALALDAYLQALEIEHNAIDECALTLVRPDGTERPLEPGRDHACRGLTGSGSFTAPVVFAGYGLSFPERGYDDYAGIDVRGRIVLALKEAPTFQADSAGWGEAWMPAPKGRVAHEHGALALLVVSRPNQEHPQRPIGSMLEGAAEHDGDFPRLQVSVEVAEELVETAGHRLADLQARIDSTRAPASIPLGVSVRVGVRARYAPRQRSFNVIALLEGSDPALKDQVVLLGAHLDHVGGQGDVYYPGANDNASGSAAVLAIARAMAGREGRPRRSMAFALWSSEEAGLFGTRNFVEHPPFPLERVVAYLNFDCVGHGDSIEVGGGEEYPGFWNAAREIDRSGRGLMVADTRGGGGADAQPFQQAGIPNLYFASRFSYAHLHQPTDRPETLNPPLLAAVARLGRDLAWKIAQAEVEARAE